MVTHVQATADLISALQRNAELAKASSGLLGWLVGCWNGSNITLLGSLWPQQQGSDLAASLENCCRLLPYGLPIVGAVFREEPDAAAVSAATAAAATVSPHQQQQAGTSSHPWVVSVVPAASEEAAPPPSFLLAAGQQSSSGGLQRVTAAEVSVQQAAEALDSELAFFRCSLSVPLHVFGADLQSAAESAHRQLCPPSAAFFLLPPPQQQQQQQPQKKVPQQQQQQQQQQQSLSAPLDRLKAGVTAQALGGSSAAPVAVGVYRTASSTPQTDISSNTSTAAAAAGGSIGDGGSVGDGAAAAAVVYEPVSVGQGGARSVPYACLEVTVDVVVATLKRMAAADLPDKVLKPALGRQLRAAALAAGSHVASSSSSSPPRHASALHFLPLGWAAPVTVVHPLRASARGVDRGGADEDEDKDEEDSAQEEEEAMKEARRALHRELGLPLDRPLLRVGNALSLPSLAAAASSSAASSGAGGKQGSGGGIGGRRLRDVHVGLPPHGVPGGTAVVVQGTYDYYHYMQDGMNDSGWGCAYRSLQTLSSWFLRQAYTGRAPPTHREIQTTLAKIGDKPSSFVGSSLWIGAIELGYVLDELLGVTCKVITASCGEDVPSKARELAHHFATQGTPVMIGGGVLAYTCLGVAHNQDTGEAAFLILDPHYTGPDSLDKVQGGQWVAWKRLGDKAAAGGELFVKGAHYNLLCPQRPQAI